jgi:hypothetical protein
MLKEINEKLKLIRRICARNFLEEIKLLFILMKYGLFRGHISLNMIVEVDSMKYKARAKLTKTIYHNSARSKP